HRCLRAPRQIQRAELLQRPGAEDEWAELGRTRQIVAHAMAGRILARNRKLLLGIHRGHVRPSQSIREIKSRARQPLAQEPYSARVAAGWLGAHEGGNGIRRDLSKQPAQNGQIETLVFEGKGQMTVEISTRRMA